MDEQYRLNGCVDCVMAIANDEYPDDDERSRAILAGESKWWNEGYVVVNGSDDEGHFSWQPCDLCGSRLGGDRETLWAVLR
jgi:hypothetical protein